MRRPHNPRRRCLAVQLRVRGPRLCRRKSGDTWYSDMCGKLEETDLTKLLNGETPAREVIRGRIGRSTTRQVAEIEAAEQLRVPLFQISSHDTSGNLAAGSDTTTSVIISADTAGEPLTTSVALTLRGGPPRPKSCGKPPDSAEYWLPIN